MVDWWHWWDWCCEWDLIVNGWGIQDLSWMVSWAMTREDTSRQKDSFSVDNVNK